MTDNNSKLRAVLLAALMVLWVFAGTMAFAGSAAAANNADFTATPDTAGDSAELVASVDADSGQSVNEVQIDFSGASGFDNGFASDISSSDVQSSQATVDTVEVSNGGSTLSISYSSSFTASGVTETITVADTAWQNPSDSSNDYDGVIQFNYQSGGPSDTGTLTLTKGATEAGSDQTFDTATTRWQGQGLFLDKGGLADNHTQWQLRQWDRTAANDRLGSLERELSFDSQDTTVINTDALEGDYVVTANDNSGSGAREVIITNANGVAKQSVGPSTTAADGQYVEVVVQDLTTEFVDSAGDTQDEVELGESTNLSVDSNRNSFDIVISSENLTQTQLENIFAGASAVAGNDENVTITGVQSDDEIEATFSSSNDIEEGDIYDFNVEASDTTANDTASISVGEEATGDASWNQAQFTDQRGDVVEISLTSDELSRFNVTIGGDDSNYQANLEVEPNDDGNVTLLVNTYLASRTGASGDVFEADEGTILNESQTGNNARALDAGLYDVIIEDSNYTTAPADIQEYDVSVLSLQERSTGNMTVHTAPTNNFNQLVDQEDVAEAVEEGSVTESEEIAINTERSGQPVNGDVIVHKVDVSGIEGILAATGGSDYNAVTSASANSNEAFNVTLSQTNPGQNADPIVASLGNELTTSNSRVIADAENDTVYIIARSSALEGLGAETGDEFEAQFNVTAEYQNQFRRSSNQLDTTAANNQSAADNFELVDREATFDTVSDEVRVQPAADQVISGTTTIAPGTEISVRARATAEDTDGDNAFLKSASTRVNADGTFEATFNGSDSFEDVTPPQNFTATIQRQSFDSNAETDGRVVEGDYAEVSITNQTTDGTTVTVDSVYLPDGGFVTIHDGTLLDGATFDSVRGTSDALDSGESTDVEVTLDTPYEADGTVIAMPHMDSNDNGEYDFVTSEGSEDGPYTNAEGEIVLDSASLTVDTSTPTPTATATATPEPTATPTDEPTETATATASEDQPGFGAVIALIALLGAALLAARRNAF